ncbi:hypothetical protein [Alteribacter aurantiacus]|uniref:hypothetical protein n=1 Tax=Alteribacter aurantiacus TaxID=254410 RepID=UPI0004058305|nr:hypothetical protein [Alteribacter aurantiacus]
MSCINCKGSGFLWCNGKRRECVCVNVESATITNVGPNLSNQFNALNVSERTPIVELFSVYGINEIRDLVLGDVTNDGTEYLVSTALASPSFLQSVERGRYIPGYAAEGGIGVRTDSVPEGNQVMRWGVFDESNGFFFGRNATGIFIAVRREGATDLLVQQPNWNIDPLDGTGPSGYVLELDRGNIFQIVFTWYGYGVINFNVVIQDADTLAQEVVTVHRFRPEMETSTTDPNLPLRAEADDNGTDATPLELFVGGRQYSIIGKYNPTFRITSEIRSITIGALGVPTTFISFRRKPIFPAGSARPNSVTVQLEGLDIGATNAVTYEIRVGGTPTGTYGNIANIPPNETALEVSTDISNLTGGIAIYKGVAPGGGVNRALATESQLDLNLIDLEPITLIITSLANNNPTTVSFRMREEW